MQEIKAAAEARGWAAIISSTHSHLSPWTTVKRLNWEKFQTSQDGGVPTPARFLVQEKKYLPRVASGAEIFEVTDEYVTFSHKPCPKFRIAIPLLRPWRANEYEDQERANDVWKGRVQALAAALSLAHDQACTDTSRLFYLPRRPHNGPPAETGVLEGEPCNIFALPPADGDRGRHTRDHRSGGDKQRRHDPRDGKPEFVDPVTGEVCDLSAWAREHGRVFEIAKALQARHPSAFVPRHGEGSKRHIRCVNESEHTQADSDAATIVINASESENKGFVYHCRHGHCDGRDRLFFLRQMLEQQWLAVADLTDARFLSAEKRKASHHASLELTEHGVASVYAQEYKDTLRYCHTAGAWYFWTGNHWAKNETRLAFHWARQLVAALNRGTELKTRVATGKAAFAGAVERFAAADDELAVTAAVWDPDPWLLGTPAGMVDLRTGKLPPAERNDMGTKITSVGPDVTADCPRWLAFLAAATGEDHDLIGFLQRWLGYCLTGVTREHALLFVYGPGGNGKGVLLVTVAGILARLGQ